MSDSEDSFVVPTKKKDKKRRSLYPPSETNSEAFDSVLFDENEDAESLHSTRIEKRRSAVLASLSNRSRAERTLSTSDGDKEKYKSVALLTPDEMKKQFDTALELHVKNKISEKNVFSLNLNLAQLIYQKTASYGAGDQVDFQEAATGIDAATKIWCCKVDSMHTEATQAVKDLIEAKPVDEDFQSDDDSQGNTGGDGKKKRTRRKLAETFFSDPKSITNKKWGEKKDPYCQEVASKLDSATDISKLRLSNQPLEMADSLAIFPNDDVSRYAIDEEKEDAMDVEESAEYDDDHFAAVLADLGEISSEFTQTENIAPTFNKETIEELMKTPAPPPPKTQSQAPIDDDIQSVIFDDPPPLQDFDDHPHDHFEEDDDRPPMPPNLDMDDVASIFGDQVASSVFGDQLDAASTVMSSMFGGQDGVMGTNKVIDNLADTSVLRDDYLELCFKAPVKFRKPRLPPRVKQILRGSQILNADPFQNEAAGSAPKVSRPKRPKAPKLTLDIRQRVEESDLETKLPKRKTKKALNEAELSKFIQDDYDSRPSQDIEFNFNKFALRTAMKFGTLCAGSSIPGPTVPEWSDDEGHMMPPEPPGLSDDEAADFADQAGDFGIPTSDLGGDDAPPPFDENLGGDSQDEGPLMSDEALPTPAFGAADLLQVRTVEKIKMNFERRPKRVNVRQVKTKMWDIIDNDFKDSSRNGLELLSILENSIVENDAEVPETNFKFSDLREQLDSVLTGETRENLTGPMALVCCLYLANEKGLELVQEDGQMDDFKIIHPEGQKMSE